MWRHRAHGGRTEIFLAERSNVVLRLGDPCELPKAAPGSRSTAVAADARVPAALVGSLPMGRAVQGCAVVRAGGLAWRGLGGRRPVGHDAFRSNLSAS